MSGGSLLNRMLEGTPDGRKFATIPWEALDPTILAKLPWFLRPIKPFPLKIAIFAFLCAIVGHIGRIPAVSALGFAFLAAIAASYLWLWRRTSDLEVGTSTSLIRVIEGAEIRFTLNVINRSKYAIGPLLARCIFHGDVEHDRNFLIPRIGPKERRNLSIVFKASRSMGEYKLSPVEIMYFDPLGFFSLSTTHEVNVTVEVIPEEIEMPDLALTASGLTMHSGIFESRRSGDSPTFLGIRPYITGDSIRRIDWKRSQRLSQLVVKEYEQLNATDATIFMDMRRVAQFEFAEMSTLEAVRDSTIAVAANLIGQQVRVQVWADDVHIPFGKGRAHLDWIREIVRDLRPGANDNIAQEIGRIGHSIPPDSVFIPVFVRAGIDFERMTSELFTFHEQRIDVIPIIIDSDKFTAEIGRAARFSPEQLQIIWAAKGIDDRRNRQALDLFAERLAERMIWIGPRETIATIYERDHAWRSHTRPR